MRLIFVNRYFYPDQSATSRILSDIAMSLASDGRSVQVITSRQLYQKPAERLPHEEEVHGVKVHRVWTSRFGRSTLIGRALDYLAFYVSAAWRLWRVAGPGDVVIAKTDPPVFSVAAAPVCWLRNAMLVNWLQDIFPETAHVLGVGGRGAIGFYGCVRVLRNASLRVARMNVVLGERMAGRLMALGIARDRVRIVPNWADGDAIGPIEHGANVLRGEWGIGDAFVVGYCGNLGQAHEIDTILEAMSILEAPDGLAPDRQLAKRQILWLFVGGGSLLETLKQKVATRGLQCVRFKPYQPQELLAETLSAADVHLVSLRPELEGLIVPSKFYGIAAAGRPSIFIGDPDGEIGRLTMRFGCGRVVEAGHGAALAKCILSLASDQETVRRLGEQARRAALVEFDRSLAIDRWRNLMIEVAAPVLASSPLEAVKRDAGTEQEA